MTLTEKSNHGKVIAGTHARFENIIPFSLTKAKVKKKQHLKEEQEKFSSSYASGLTILHTL